MLLQRFQQVLKTWWLGSLWVLALLVVPLLQQRLPESGALVFELRVMVSVMGIIAGGILLALDWSGLKKNLWVWSLVFVQSVLVVVAALGLGPFAVSYLFTLGALLAFGWLMAE